MANLPSVAQLQAFECTARYLSFQKAASELNVTASAVSHRIRDFEALTNTVLFHRDVRSIRLTKQGQAKLPEIRRLLSGLENLTSSKPAATNTLKLTMPSLFFTQLVLPNLSSFHSQYSDINLDIQVTLNNKPTNRLDAAVIYGNSRKEGWKTYPLMASSEILVASTAFLNSVSQPDLSDILEEGPLIALAYAPKAWQPWFRLAKLTSSKARAAINVSNMTEALAAAKAGLGVAIVIKELVSHELEEGKLIQINHAEKRKSKFYLAVNNHGTNKKIGSIVQQWLMDIADDLA